MILLLLSLIFSTQLWCTSDITDSSLGVFNLTQWPHQVQVKETGEKGNFQFTPGVKFDLFHDLPQNFNLLLSGGLTIPHKGKDKNIQKTEAFINYQVGYRYCFVLISLGAGFFWSSISAKGKTTTLPNGTSTSTFYLPPERHIAVNAPLVTELHIFFTENYRATIEGLLFNPINSQTRSYAYIFSLNYNFGEIDL